MNKKRRMRAWANKQPGANAPALRAHRNTLAGAPTALRIVTYKISWDPLESDPRKAHMAPEVRSASTELYNLAHDEPEKAVEVIRAWIQRYPKEPTLYNFLASALSRCGREAESIEVVALNLMENPDYLFGRINAVQVALEAGDLELADDLLDGRYDLALYYPDQREFHISEYVGLTSVSAWYLAASGDLEQASLLLRGLLSMAPDAPITKRVCKEFPAPLLRRIRAEAADDREQIERERRESVRNLAEP